MAAASSWREQYDRMNRWRHRLWLGTIDGDDLRDVFYAFAQSCYHLGDWLWNDPTPPVNKPEVRAHTNASSALKLCGEICNGVKHARLAQKGVQLAVNSFVETVNIPADTEEEAREIRIDRYELFVEWNGQSVNVERFAEVCVGEWDQFLRDRGLLAAPATRIMALIGGAAYTMMRDAASALAESDARRIAINDAIRLPGGVGWELRCSPEVGQYLREWLGQAEEWLKTQPNGEPWARSCRTSADSIAGALAAQAQP